jgi:uncharacterized protein (TIGR00251 family)
MILISPHTEGATLAVRAQPKAKRNEIVGEHACMLKIAVTAPPEDGKANEAIAEVLRRHYFFQKSQIVLLSGHASRNKVFLIRGVTQAQLLALVESSLQPKP